MNQSIGSFIKENAFGVSNVLCVLVVLFLAYLTLPAILFMLLSMLLPEPEKTEILLKFWESPLSFTQGVALFGSLFLSALLLMFIQRVKQVRASGTRIIPLWFIALIVGLFAAFIIVLFAFAFSVFTIEFITSASKESLMAVLFIFLVVILTMRFLK